MLDLVTSLRPVSKKPSLSWSRYRKVLWVPHVFITCVRPDIFLIFDRQVVPRTYDEPNTVPSYCPPLHCQPTLDLGL